MVLIILLLFGRKCFTLNFSLLGFVSWNTLVVVHLSRCPSRTAGSSCPAVPQGQGQGPAQQGGAALKQMGPGASVPGSSRASANYEFHGRE